MFDGPKLQLGQLIHYRLHDPKLRHKFAASTAPGLYAGWRFEQGFVYRVVVWVLDYESIKANTPGYQSVIPIPIGEIHIPDVEVFPLRNATDLALKEFQSVKLDSITALDIPFSSLTIADPPRKRAEYITLERILKFGATPSCKGCRFESTTHSPVCRARLESLIKADRISKAPRTPVPPTPPLEPPPAEVRPSPEEVQLKPLQTMVPTTLVQSVLRKGWLQSRRGNSGVCR